MDTQEKYNSLIRISLKTKYSETEFQCIFGYAWNFKNKEEFGTSMVRYTKKSLKNANRFWHVVLNLYTTNTLSKLFIEKNITEIKEIIKQLRNNI